MFVSLITSSSSSMTTHNNTTTHQGMQLETRKARRQNDEGFAEEWPLHKPPTKNLCTTIH
jgi:hypothetical protein